MGIAQSLPCGVCCWEKGAVGAVVGVSGGCRVGGVGENCLSGYRVHSADNFIKFPGRHTTQTQISEVKWATRFSGYWMATNMVA